MSRNSWLKLGLALSVALSASSAMVLADELPPGNWLYEQSKQQILEAEKQAKEARGQTDTADDSAKKAADGDKSPAADKVADYDKSGNKKVEPEDKDKDDKDKKADKDDKDKKADADKKDDEKDKDKKADGDKKDDKDKKADGDKKNDKDKKADGDKKDDKDKKAEEEKLEKEKKEKLAEEEKKEKKEKEEKPMAYDPLKDAMFDISVQKYDDGIALLKKVLTGNPKNVNAHYLLAVTYVMKRNYPQATDEYKAVMQLAPNSSIGKLAEEGLKKIHK